MLHVVVKELGNKVDRIERSECIEQAASFPAGADQLDMDDPRIRDIVAVGLSQQGIDPGDDAHLTGFVYRDGEHLHVMAWIGGAD
ncbi:hypothetical protein BLA3211_06887 [Burkholderia aenigmatica]|uniref:Uncharacterized protein n=2 Tax=Burkholderiaceae TaxID=119060 RepID=A0A6J5JLZ8_9BURK|nr:hypothetical protein BLA3211_06887 [Burkholderia aenigmatica]